MSKDRKGIGPKAVLAATQAAVDREHRVTREMVDATNALLTAIDSGTIGDLINARTRVRVAIERAEEFLRHA